MSYRIDDYVLKRRASTVEDHEQALNELWKSIDSESMVFRLDFQEATADMEPHWVLNKNVYNTKTGNSMKLPSKDIEVLEALEAHAGGYATMYPSFAQTMSFNSRAKANVTTMDDIEIFPGKWDRILAPLKEVGITYPVGNPIYSGGEEVKFYDFHVQKLDEIGNPAEEAETTGLVTTLAVAPNIGSHKLVKLPNTTKHVKLAIKKPEDVKPDVEKRVLAKSDLRNAETVDDVARGGQSFNYPIRKDEGLVNKEDLDGDWLILNTSRAENMGSSQIEDEDWEKL